MLRKTSILLAVLVLAAPAAMAQGVSFGPQVGFFSTEDADDDFNVMPGLVLRAHLSPGLAVEGSINYRQESYYEDDLTVRTWPVMVTGMLFPLPSVYGAVGAGWYNTTFDWDNALDLENETTNEFGWHFGGGLELPLSPQTMLTGDIRYVFLDYDFERLPGTEGVDANFFVITVGLLFGSGR